MEIRWRERLIEKRLRTSPKKQKKRKEATIMNSMKYEIGFKKTQVRLIVVTLYLSRRCTHVHTYKILTTKKGQPVLYNILNIHDYTEHF